MVEMRPAVLLVLASCSFSTTIGASGGDDAPDAAPDVPDLPEGACGTAGALRDDFADGTPAPFWDTPNAAASTESGGTLVVRPVATTFSGYRANVYVDMRESTAEVELRTAPEAANGGASYFRYVNGTGAFGFGTVNGTLVIGVAPTPLTSIPYDPALHRHLRIAHTGTTLAFSTSPDGQVWTERSTAPAPAYVGSVSLEVGASNNNASPAPGIATFAALNTTVATAKWCDVATLTDAFDDGQIGLPWARHGHSTSGCIEYENGSNARVDQNGSAACDAYFGSSALYRLTGSQITAMLPAITTYTNGWITYLGVWDVTDQKFVRLMFDQNQMCAFGTGTLRTCVPYATTRDQWRIREAGGTLYFEFGNASGFTLVHSLPAPFALDAVRVYFGTLTDRAIGQNIGLNVARFN
jgi:hypothetical protein